MIKIETDLDAKTARDLARRRPCSGNWALSQHRARALALVALQFFLIVFGAPSITNANDPASKPVASTEPGSEAAESVEYSDKLAGGREIRCLRRKNQTAPAQPPVGGRAGGLAREEYVHRIVLVDGDKESEIWKFATSDLVDGVHRRRNERFEMLAVHLEDKWLVYVWRWSQSTFATVVSIDPESGATHSAHEDRLLFEQDEKHFRVGSANFTGTITGGDLEVQLNDVAPKQDPNWEPPRRRAYDGTKSEAPWGLPVQDG